MCSWAPCWRHSSHSPRLPLSSQVRLLPDTRLRPWTLASLGFPSVFVCPLSGSVPGTQWVLHMCWINQLMNKRSSLLISKVSFFFTIYIILNYKGSAGKVFWLQLACLRQMSDHQPSRTPTSSARCWDASISLCVLQCRGRVGHTNQVDDTQCAESAPLYSFSLLTNSFQQ